MIEESDVVRIDLTMDFVCKRDIVSAEGSAGLRAGERRKVGGGIVGRRGLKLNTERYIAPISPPRGLLGGGDRFDVVCGDSGTESAPMKETRTPCG